MEGVEGVEGVELKEEVGGLDGVDGMDETGGQESTVEYGRGHVGWSGSVP